MKTSSVVNRFRPLYLGIDEYTSSKAKITEALIFCRRQFIKKDSLESVLRPLIDDIKYLEKNGFSKVINGENVVLNVSIAYNIGDNLGVVELLCFRQSFSRGFVCIYCSSTDCTAVVGFLNIRKNIGI